MEISLFEKVDPIYIASMKAFRFPLCGKGRRIAVTAILPGGLQEVLNEKDTEEK